MRTIFILICTAFLLISAQARLYGASSSEERVYVDRGGVIRWTADNREVAIFGANYSLASACDYRAAGQVGADRKKLVDEDFAHFARMGFTGVRFCFWGDWENSDEKGNLIENDHLDLLDYAVSVAGKRGIGILFTPITTYSSLFPDGKDGPEIKGFSKFFKKEVLGTDPAAGSARTCEPAPCGAAERHDSIKRAIPAAFRNLSLRICIISQGC